MVKIVGILPHGKKKKNFVVCLVSSLYLHKYWHTGNWTLWNKFQWNLNENVISININPFENVLCNMADILSRPQCIKRAPDVLFIPQRNTHTHTIPIFPYLSKLKSAITSCLCVVANMHGWHQLNNGRSGFPEVLVNQYVVYIGWL